MTRPDSRDGVDAWPWEPVTDPPSPRRPSWLAPPLHAKSPTARDGTVQEADLPPNDELLTVPAGGGLPRLTPEPPSESGTFVAAASLPPYPDLRDENAELRAQVRSTLEATRRLRSEILRATEPEILRLACAVAERVARAELTARPSLVVEWVREAVDALASADSIVIAIAPDVAALVDETTLSSVHPNVTKVEVDRALEGMACEVRTRVSRVDASLEARLATIVEALTDGVE